MSKMMEYKCPSCGGAVQFDSASQEMKCPYCDSTFSIEALEEYAKEQELLEKEDSYEWEEYQGNADAKPETEEQFVTYVCQSCGGEIITDANTAATKCPYCDNPVTVSKQLTGAYLPDYVIPFKIEKKQVKAALKEHLKGKMLLPKLFSDQNRIDSVTGMYVPCWMFDCDTDAHITYRATRVKTWSDSDYHYTKTDHYSVIREGKLDFEKVPVDGSKKMQDDYMESIEPFDYSAAVEFSPAYLAGYLAEKYDVDSKEAIPRANERIKSSVVEKFRDTVVGYNGTVNEENSNINLKNGKVSYALFPVWMLCTKYKGKMYTFAMNGQTGKFIGELPVDRKKFWGWYAGITAAVTVLGTILLSVI